MNEICRKTLNEAQSPLCILFKKKFFFKSSFFLRECLEQQNKYKTKKKRNFTSVSFSIQYFFIFSAAKEKKKTKLRSKTINSPMRIYNNYYFSIRRD